MLDSIRMRVRRKISRRALWRGQEKRVAPRLFRLGDVVCGATRVPVRTESQSRVLRDMRADYSRTSVR
jgi:hypothetical protein